MRDEVKVLFNFAQVNFACEKEANLLFSHENLTFQSQGKGRRLHH